MTNRIENLIQEIGESVADNVPSENWSKITLEAKILGSYVELTADWFDINNNKNSFNPDYPIDTNSKSIVDVVLELRTEMYNQHPEKGPWYTIVMHIGNNGDFNLSYDYEQQPSFTYPPDDRDYLLDLEEYPRSPANTPEWLLKFT